ncbi:FtsK/SpoIIIE domain-containing protein [Demequina soli]|uniref:FtsK/SpoIIIE domain-containing protein n=1 Tax=Demequina soli TaxID=1638987 RepID=UPI0007865B0F|nr:FtsK/SpoIIIE domain-containing protein [Demequina soli]
MRITVEGVGDVDVDPGTTLGTALAALRAPAAVWCGGARLDPDHRAGLAPLLEGALLASVPGPGALPPDGPHLRVVVGPDAGAIVEVRRGEAALGRAGVPPLADPRLSRRHLALDAAGRVRDVGSRNGTVVVRRAHRRRLGRTRRRLRPDDLLEAGATALRWVDPGDDARRASDARTGPAARPAPLAFGAGGALAGAVALGALTGRWSVALAAAAVPLAIAGARLLRHRRAGEPPPAGLEALADVPLPVAIRGDDATARGVARAVALARGAGPPPSLGEAWGRWLPDALPDDAVRIVPPGAPAPSETAALVDAMAGTIEAGGRERPWRVACVTEATAGRLARAAASHRPAGLPDALRWADLPPPPAAAPARSDAGGAPRRLVATIGVGEDGPVTLDLDRDGPHVLVAGTTGSGKSALLETLVCALAWAHPPDALGVGLVDLKGGAGLAACARLPHVRGVLTDLDPASARRALLGVAHELRRRKRALADAGLPSWEAWERRDGAAAPARLLVVVDEFQELGALDPGLLPELARLAAQGRSLGMHLVAATQRPAGAVTPAIRANVATVVALRTASPAESQDLLGDAAAAALPAGRPGRAILARPSGRVTVQAALPLADARPPVRVVGRPEAPGRPLALVVRDRWPEPPPAPLWLPPLPPDIGAPPGALGWVDLPEERARAPLAWDPAEGPLVVVGPRGSGRTGVLAAVAASLPGVVMLPADPREAARALDLCAAAAPSALLVDDADRACAAMEGHLRGAAQALEDLARVVPVALACGPGWGSRWAARAGLRVVLAGLDRVEQAVWGVPAVLATLPPEPGRGVALGARVAGECRIVRAEAVATRALVRPLAWDGDLPAGAAGVVGDDARPLVLPPDGVTVVGPAGPAREAALAAVRSAGCAAHPADPPGSGATVEVVVDPTPARLRELGIVAAPGIADPAPSRGRVVIRRAGAVEAALLRVPR